MEWSHTNIITHTKFLRVNLLAIKPRLSFQSYGALIAVIASNFLNRASEWCGQLEGVVWYAFRSWSLFKGMFFFYDILLCVEYRCYVIRNKVNWGAVKPDSLYMAMDDSYLFNLCVTCQSWLESMCFRVVFFLCWPAYHMHELEISNTTSMDYQMMVNSITFRTAIVPIFLCNFGYSSQRGQTNYVCTVSGHSMWQLTAVQ